MSYEGNLQINNLNVGEFEVKGMRYEVRSTKEASQCLRCHVRNAAYFLPVFVLAFCIFYKNVYCSQLVPEIQSLKFKFFGHDLVILHEK